MSCARLHVEPNVSSRTSNAARTEPCVYFQRVTLCSSIVQRVIRIPVFMSCLNASCSSASVWISLSVRKVFFLFYIECLGRIPSMFIGS